jgi:hypothetical protein
VRVCGDALLGMRDMEAMVDLLRFGVPAWPHERLQARPQPYPALLVEVMVDLAAFWSPRLAPRAPAGATPTLPCPAAPRRARLADKRVQARRGLPAALWPDRSRA